MTAAEREQRSRLAQLIHQAGLVRGTLLVRKRLCGKPGCRCASGDRHVSLALQVTKDGKSQQVHVPKDLEEEVTRWVAQYQEARAHLETLSDLHVRKIQGHMKKRRR
jgi:hypothetical protein